MIRQQAIIAKSPPENIVQEEDSHILLLIIIVAGDIDVMVEDFGFPTLWVAVPGEAGGAAGGHFCFGVRVFGRGGGWEGGWGWGGGGWDKKGDGGGG